MLNPKFMPGTKAILLVAASALAGAVWLIRTGTLPQSWQASYAAALALAGIIATGLIVRHRASRPDVPIEPVHDFLSFRSLFDNSPDPAWIISDNHFIECNSAAARMLGYADKQSLLNTHPSQLSPPFQPDGEDSFAKAERMMAMALSQGLHRFEWVHRRADGSDFCSEVTLSALSTPAGPVIYCVWRDISERKRVEQELVENHSVLQTILESLPMRIFWKDRECRYLGCNTAFARDAGAAAPPDLVGRFDNELAWCDQAALYQADDKAVMDSGQAKLGYEEPQTTPQGDRIWLRTSKVPLRSSNGAVIGVLGMYEDVTAEKQMQRREQIRRDVLESIAQGRPLPQVLEELVLAVEADLPGALCSILLLDARRGRLFHGAGPSLPDFYNQAIDGLALGNGVGSCGTAAYENQRVIAVDITSDPNWTDFADLAERAGLGSCWSEPIRDRAGQVLGTFAVYRRQPHNPSAAETDLLVQSAFLASIAMERQAADESLRLKHAELEHAQSVAHMGSWSYFVDSQVYTASAETKRILGVGGEQDMSQAEVMALVHPDDHDRVMAAQWESMRGKPYDIEFRIVTRDGEKWVHSLAEPTLSVDGRAIAAHGTLQDITERKRNEAEMARYRDNLEELIGERTAELQQARLDAERLAAVKSEFLARMSHEIRTPLNAVLGLAQIGMKSGADSEAAAKFAGIVDAGRHLLGVINDILDFSKIETGKLVIEAHPFPLRSAVDEAVALVAGRATEKGLPIRIQWAEDLPAWVNGDSLRLGQVLVNLLSNAVKFTDAGEVSLTVRRDGPQIVFVVADTGIGMDEAQRARLFMPFEQADGSITRKFGGTGLGLAISRNLAELMGGFVTVESRVGDGSRFTLALPLPEVDAPAQVAEAARPLLKERLNGLRVLAAEDVEVNRLVLETLLKSEGAQVLFAVNGREAVECLAARGGKAFDVILMDVQMPIMDGYEATRRCHELAPNLPVIGLTAHALGEERSRALASGMLEHVTKPIDIDELVRAIVRVTQRSNDLPNSEAVESAALPGDGSASDAPIPPPALRSPAGSLVDWQALEAEFAGKEGFVDKLVATAIRTQSATPEKIRAVRDARNWPDLTFVAHSLASFGGALKVVGLHDLARRTEAAARGEKPEAAELAGELADFCEQTLAELARRETSRTGQ
jgi:PAS domain S-box-containing protein